MEATKSPALALLTQSLAGMALAEQDLREKVQLVRSCGASWAEIGEVLGVSRQAAQQRFGRSDDARRTATTEHPNGRP